MAIVAYIDSITVSGIQKWISSSQAWGGWVMGEPEEALQSLAKVRSFFPPIALVEMVSTFTIKWMNL